MSACLALASLPCRHRLPVDEPSDPSYVRLMPPRPPGARRTERTKRRRDAIRRRSCRCCNAMRRNLDVDWPATSGAENNTTVEINKNEFRGRLLLPLRQTGRRKEYISAVVASVLRCQTRARPTTQTVDFSTSSRRRAPSWKLNSGQQSSILPCGAACAVTACKLLPGKDKSLCRASL